MTMVAAIAAFSDSQWGFMGMISSRSAESRTACRTPLPSLPITRAIALRSAERMSTARSERAVTPMGIFASRQAVRTSSHPPG